MTSDSRCGAAQAPNGRPWPHITAGLAVAAILAATLFPAPPVPPMPRWCIFCGALGGLDFTLNVVLFAPLGLALALLSKSTLRVVAAGFALSVLIELLQIRVVTGRDASLGDLIANTIGTIAGLGVARYGLVMLAAHGKAARRLALAWLAVVTATLSASAILLQPSPPRAAQWVQWVHPRIGFDDFPGSLLEVTLNGLPVLEGQQLNPGDQTHPFAHDTLVVHATVAPEQRRSRGTALITRLAGPAHEAFMLGARGDDAVFRTRMRAADVRLRSLHLRLPRALSARPSNGVATSTGRPDTIRLEAVHARDAIVLRRLDPAPSLEARLPLSVALGWTMLLPWEVTLAPHQAALGSSLELALLFFPLAFWTRRSVRTGRSGPAFATMTRALAPVLLGGAALFIVPAIAVAAAVSLVEWIGALMGAVVGWIAGSRLSA